MLLSLRKVYLSSNLLHNVANPVPRSRTLKTQAEKPYISLRVRHGPAWNKPKKIEVKKDVSKPIEIPKITAMKDYVPVEKVKVAKTVVVKPKKPPVDRGREHMLTLGKLRKFEPVQKLDLKYYRKDNPDPPGPHFEEHIAPDLFMRTTQTGGFSKILVLNNYDTYNTLDVPLFNRLDSLLKKWEHDQVITSIIFEASFRNFSAGLDYQSTFQTKEEKEFLERRFQNAYRVYTMRKPFIPIMSGLVLGNASSMGLLANCSMATESSLFNIPEPSFGYIPDAGVPFALSRTGYRGLGEFLAVTGQSLRGHDLFLSRLARYYTPDERISAAETEIGCIYTNRINRLLVSLNTVHEPVYRNKFSLREKLPIIGPCFDKDTIQEVFRALEASSTGYATDLLNKMKSFSPLCLAVTHRLVREALDTNIETSLKRNFIASQNIMRSADYAEGIKAKMENREPKWSHKSVFDVTKEEVEAIFTSNEHTTTLELEASSFVPLNGPVFRYIQAKTTPQPIVGGSFYAEFDGLNLYRENDYLGKLIYRKSQVKADRIYYKTNPEKLKAWMPGGEKAAEFFKDEPDTDMSQFSKTTPEEREINKAQVEEFIESATSSAEPIGLLPDYEFLKTEEPPTEKDEAPVHASPYYEEIEDEQFPVQDDTFIDEDVIVKRNRRDMRKRRTSLIEQYGDRTQFNQHLSDQMIWLGRLDEEDEY